MPFDVLLVEDHRMVRESIRTVIERSQEFRVIGELASGAEAIGFCKRTPPHIVLMDLSLPGLNGLEATAEITRHSGSIKVLVLSMYDDDNSVVSAIRAGARGFVLKQGSITELIEALRTVAKGGSYLSPPVSDRLLARIQKGNLEPAPLPPALEELSPRELQVLRLVAEGKTSKDIAVALDLGLQTIRSYRKTMMKKLGVNNIASLTHLALAAGLTANLAPPRKEPSTL
jgi:DNA-binding NarL/FixJ family response regulator